MNDSLTPWKILAATAGVGVLTEGWNLADVPDDAEQQTRQFIVDIAFASPFQAPPVVHLGMTGFDADQSASGRISLKTADITADGFKAVITTWRDSRVHAVEFDWLAIGA